jgi:hypothetical protein
MSPKREKEMSITQEAIYAEINYRLERAHSAALVQEAREARRQRPSRLRRWLTRASRPPVASPAFKHTESRFRADLGVHENATHPV